jgi:hypothetical protein
MREPTMILNEYPMANTAVYIELQRQESAQPGAREIVYELAGRPQ